VQNCRPSALQVGPFTCRVRMPGSLHMPPRLGLQKNEGQETKEI
jgi:hypothetical protein